MSLPAGSDGKITLRLSELGCARSYARGSGCISPLKSLQRCCLTPILQRRETGPREAKYLAQGHVASERLQQRGLLSVPRMASVGVEAVLLHLPPCGKGCSLLCVIFFEIVFWIQGLQGTCGSSIASGMAIRPLPSYRSCANGHSESERLTFTCLITRAQSTNDPFNRQVVFTKSHRQLGTRRCGVDKLRFGGLGLAGPEFKS